MVDYPAMGALSEHPHRSAAGRAARWSMYVALSGLALIVAGIFAPAFFPELYSTSPMYSSAARIYNAAVSLSVLMAAVGWGVYEFYSDRENLGRRGDAGEAQARERVRQAEASLAEALIARKPSSIDRQAPEGASAPAHAAIADTSDPLSIERHDERLTLVALWRVTDGRLELYNQIVTTQAKRSFASARTAMVFCFLILIGLAVLAAVLKTPAAAITAGGLAAVVAAFSAFIGRTFVRSQEAAASHLRAYFDQPLEFSRYLAAERLLAADTELSGEQRAAILSLLVEAITGGGNRHG
jgi:hypothetical protein